MSFLGVLTSTLKQFRDESTKDEGYSYFIPKLNFILALYSTDNQSNSVTAVLDLITEFAEADTLSSKPWKDLIDKVRAFCSTAQGRRLDKIIRDNKFRFDEPAISVSFRQTRSIKITDPNSNKSNSSFPTLSQSYPGNSSLPFFSKEALRKSDPERRTSGTFDSDTRENKRKNSGEGVTKAVTKITRSQTKFKIAPMNLMQLRAELVELLNYGTEDVKRALESLIGNIDKKLSSQISKDIIDDLRRIYSLRHAALVTNKDNLSTNKCYTQFRGHPNSLWIQLAFKMKQQNLFPEDPYRFLMPSLQQDTLCYTDELLSDYPLSYYVLSESKRYLISLYQSEINYKSTGVFQNCSAIPLAVFTQTEIDRIQHADPIYLQYYNLLNIPGEEASITRKAKLKIDFLIRNIFAPTGLYPNDVSLGGIYHEVSVKDYNDVSDLRANIALYLFNAWLFALPEDERTNLYKECIHLGNTNFSFKKLIEDSMNYQCLTTLSKYFFVLSYSYSMGAIPNVGEIAQRWTEIPSIQNSFDTGVRKYKIYRDFEYIDQEEAYKRLQTLYVFLNVRNYITLEASLINRTKFDPLDLEQLREMIQNKKNIEDARALYCRFINSVETSISAAELASLTRIALRSNSNSYIMQTSLDQSLDQASAAVIQTMTTDCIPKPKDIGCDIDEVEYHKVFEEVKLDFMRSNSSTVSLQSIADAMNIQAKQALFNCDPLLRTFIYRAMNNRYVMAYTDSLIDKLVGMIPTYGIEEVNTLISLEIVEFVEKSVGYFYKSSTMSVYREAQPVTLSDDDRNTLCYEWLVHRVCVLGSLRSNVFGYTTIDKKNYSRIERYIKNIDFHITSENEVFLRVGAMYVSDSDRMDLKKQIARISYFDSLRQSVTHIDSNQYRDQRQGYHS